jgi:hypothetical protein
VTPPGPGLARTVDINRDRGGRGTSVKAALLGASRAGWNRAGTSRDDQRALTPCGHLEVSCLPFHRPSWSPSGSRSLPCCPPAPTPIRSAATGPASLTGRSSRSSYRSWCSVAPTLEDRRPMLLGNHPATPSSRRVDRSQSDGNTQGAGSRSLRQGHRPTALRRSRRLLHHQGSLWRREGRQKPRRQGQFQGIKRSTLVDAKGIPLGAVAAPANRLDSPLLDETLWTLWRHSESYPSR